MTPGLLALTNGRNAKPMKNFKDGLVQEGCGAHSWPRIQGLVSSHGTPGDVMIEQCNGCLAIRIKFESKMHANSEWTTVRDEQVVEPSFYRKDSE